MKQSLVNMSEVLKKDCDILGIPFENVNKVTMIDVISAYRREARRVHPDKVDNESTDERRAEATAAFKALNNSYKRVLKFLLDERDENEVKEDEGHVVSL